MIQDGQITSDLIDEPEALEQRLSTRGGRHPDDTIQAQAVQHVQTDGPVWSIVVHWLLVTKDLLLVRCHAWLQDPLELQDGGGKR